MFDPAARQATRQRRIEPVRDYLTLKMPCELAAQE